jgi:hypothetical protein
MTKGYGIFQRAVQQWERFWFEHVPSDQFALARITVGTAGLISLIGFLPVPMFWSPDGIAPIPGGGLGVRAFVLESGIGVAAGWAFFLVLFAGFVCMTLGFFTSTAVAVCFLGCVFQSRWNSLPLTSGHTVLVALLFALVWADCSGWPSVDYRRKGKSTIASQPMWPLRLIQIQITLIYLSSGLFKLLGAGWRDGSAIHYTTAQNVYGRFLHLYAFPAGLDWLLTLVTYGTLFWEIGFAVMLLNRVTRRIALLLGIGIHGGILLLMEVGPFSWVMVASYVAFLEPHSVAKFMAHWRSRHLGSEVEPSESSSAVASSTSAA